MTNKEITDTNSRKPLTQEQASRIVRLFGALICFISAFALAFTPIWQLALLAGAIGGAFYSKMKYGVLVGTIGVGLGWSFYIIYQVASTSIMTLINQVTGIILGDESKGWLIVIVLVVIGLIFGALGGTLGSAIRKLIEIKREKKEN